MANVDATVMAAVRRKLNVSWEDEDTDERLNDVVAAVSPRLSSLLGYPVDHPFTDEDGASWTLFLNGCLYEFSDAWDDFEHNYADVILSTRMYVLGTLDA